MKRNNRAQSSSLFLLELILAILFFSLASAVCLQFFVKSHILSRDAQGLNLAVNECSGVAEIVNSSEGMGDALDLLREAFPYARISQEEPDTAYIYYDEKFTPCQGTDGQYVLTAKFWEEKGMLVAGLSFDSKPGKEIYQLQVEHYLQRRHANG